MNPICSIHNHVMTYGSVSGKFAYLRHGDFVCFECLSIAMKNPVIFSDEYAEWVADCWADNMEESACDW